MSLYGNASQTPLLHSLQVTQSTPGIVIPILFGTNRLTLNLLWYGDFVSGQPYQQGGKGLGKNGQAYEYYAAVLGCLCQGVIPNVLNVYSQNGRLNLNSVQENYTVPPGGGSYTVANASVFNTDAGVGAAVAYSVTANDYGSPGPVVLAGTQQVKHTAVPGSPGANQYNQSGGTYTFPASSGGLTVTISYTFSLYVLVSTEDDIIPNTSPYEITVQYAPEWRTDGGVVNIATGVAFTLSGPGPGPGEYSIDFNGNYFFNAADAGTAVAITYSWRQSNSNIDPNSMLNFTLIEGGQSQSPWTYLTSVHLSQAFGYSTLAMIGAEKMDLGEAATLPNYNFECQSSVTFGAGILDAPVDQCILALLLDPHFGAGFAGTIDASLTTVAADYWNSNGFFISPILNSSDTCASIIERWLEAGNCGVYWSEGLLKFVPYGDTSMVGNGYLYTPQTHPVVDLNDDDFFAGQNEDPVSIERSPFQDAFNSVKVQFQNRLNAYNQDIVQETDDYAISLYGLRPEAQQSYDFLCTAVAATFSANIRLKRLVYIRGKYHFTISALRYCYLEPMDLVTLTDADLGLNKTPVRIIETEENDSYELECIAEEFPWGTASATLYPKQPTLPPPPPPSLTDPGDTSITIFEPSSRVATTVANSAFQIWAALSGGPNWGGCDVWLSRDNMSFQKIGTQNGPSRFGVITADLPPGTDPDLTDTLSVAITGELFNVTDLQADALATLCLVGTEYISYANATITGSNGLQINYYDLTYLRRGAFSSPNILHQAIDPNQNQFIRLDSQIFQYSYDPSLAGQTVYLKFTSFNLLQNQEQSLADVPSIPIVIGGVNLSANMTVDAVLDGGGLTASIRVYQTGQPVGTAGQATLANGAVIVLPADIDAGQPLATQYYVNYDPFTPTYVFYTDQNAWLIDEIQNGFIRIGQVLTPTDFSIIPLTGGGSVAIGAGSGAYGSSILLPTGYLAANMLAWTTPHTAYDPSNQLQGFLSSSAPSGVLTSQFKYRSGGGPLNASSNWAAIAWTAGAAVTVTSLGGGFTSVAFTTANGDDLCVVVGQSVSGAVPVPGGFSATEFISLIGMESTNPTGNGLQVVNNASIDSLLNITGIYSDGSGNQWGGLTNVFGLFWQTGGGVTSTGVTGGVAVIVPLPASHQICFIQAVLPNAFAFSVPPAFVGGSLTTATAMRSQDGPAGSAVSHGVVNCECAGMTFTGLYKDGTGFIWGAYGNIFAIATV